MTEDVSLTVQDRLLDGLVQEGLAFRPLLVTPLVAMESKLSLRFVMTALMTVLDV